MQEVQNKPVLTGLRARKRAKTLARIQIEAMRLFVERGFETTTLDDIADAAEVSRRSLFHYFGSKEEIVFSTREDFPKLLADYVSRRPPNEPLLNMVENALIDMATRLESPQMRKISRMIRDTPALNAGEQGKYEEVELALAKALADRKNLPATDTDCQVTAAISIGILKMAVKAWVSGKESSTKGHFRASFKALRRIAS